MSKKPYRVRSGYISGHVSREALPVVEQPPMRKGSDVGMINSVAIGDVLINKAGREWGRCDSIDDELGIRVDVRDGAARWLTFGELNDPDRPWQNLGRPD